MFTPLTSSNYTSYFCDCNCGTFCKSSNYWR
nr:MAG TPA: vWA domain-containing protein [Caudoviricetes sp.]